MLNNMQKKKNIRLIIILLSLVVVLVASSFFDNKPSRLDVPRNLFEVANTNNINTVKFVSKTGQNELQFANNQWRINKNYNADPQRVTVLFSVLKQVKVRKKVSKLQTALVDSLLQTSGVKVQFYAGNELAKEFTVAGEEDKSISYFNDGEDSYIVQIPGYNVYIANIFNLDENGWRDPLVVNMDWINLNSVSVLYPAKPEEEFKVSFINRDYVMEGIDQPDSLKVTDFLDDVSRLFVNDYLFEEELKEYGTPLEKKQATVVVNDVADNNYTIEFFDKVKDDQMVIRIDSGQFALISYSKARKILKPKSFFKPKRADQ